MKIIRVTKKSDVKPKFLPPDSRTNSQIKARVLGYVKKVEDLSDEIRKYLQNQINAENPEFSNVYLGISDVYKDMEKLKKIVSSI